MLTSEIKSRFKTASDEMSFNLKNSQLNNIFAKASDAYFNSLAAKWGETLQNMIDIATITKTITITPSSNIIPYTDFPNYERLGFVKPTYTIGGETYSFPSKPIVENNKYSVFSNGSIKYPRYYLTDTSVVLSPSDTPTSVFATYLRTPYTIDFDSPSTDIPYTDANVEGIIMIALQNLAVSQREYDQSGAVIQENSFNNK